MAKLHYSETGTLTLTITDREADYLANLVGSALFHLLPDRNDSDDPGESIYDALCIAGFDGRCDPETNFVVEHPAVLRERD